MDSLQSSPPPVTLPSPLYFVITSTRPFQHSLIKNDHYYSYQYGELQPGIQIKDICPTVETANKAAERHLIEHYNFMSDYSESFYLVCSWENDDFKTVTYDSDGCFQMRSFPKERSVNDMRYPLKVNVKKVVGISFPSRLSTLLSDSDFRMARISKEDKNEMLEHLLSFLKQPGNGGVKELGFLPLPKLPRPSDVNSSAQLWFKTSGYPVFVDPKNPANFFEVPKKTVPEPNEARIRNCTTGIKRSASFYNLAIKEWMPGKHKGEEELEGHEPDVVTHLYFLGYENSLEAFYGIVRSMGFDFPVGDYGEPDYYNQVDFTPRYFQKRTKPDECEFWVRIHEVGLTVIIGDEKYSGTGVKTDRGKLYVSDWDGSVRGWNLIFPGPGRIRVP